MPQTTASRKLPGGKRTALTLVILAAHVLFALLGALVATWALVQLASPTALEDQQLSADLFMIAIAGQLILFCVGGITFLIWLHRTYANAQTFSPMTSTPGKVTASFFLPFAQLVRPYQAIQEMWRSSETPPQVPTNSKGILAWWLFLLAWEAVFFVALDEMPEAAPPSQGWWIASLVGASCAAIAATLGAWMVFSIRRRQVKRLAATIPAWALSADGQSVSYPQSPSFSDR